MVYGWLRATHEAGWFAEEFYWHIRRECNYLDVCRNHAGMCVYNVCPLHHRDICTVKVHVHVCMHNRVPDTVA